MQKTVLLTLEYPPQHGGVGVYLKGEVDAHQGIVTVIEAEQYLWEKWPKWLPLFWHAYSKVKKADMLWISHVLPMGYIALLYKTFFQTPYRVYIHGLDIVRPLESGWKTYWVQKILNEAEEIVVNSVATAELLRPYGCNPSVARVQYPRVPQIDTEKYKAVGEKLRAEHILKNKPVLVTIARLVPRKGIDDVLKSLTHVWRTMPELVYVIVGDGPHKKELEADVHAKREKQVIFTGAVSNEEKYGWLSACDAFIMTPKNDPNDFEGYGIVYREAVQFSKPVIGSRVGGVPEAVGNDGILVTAGDTHGIAGAILEKVKKKTQPKSESMEQRIPEDRDTHISVRQT